MDQPSSGVSRRDAVAVAFGDQASAPGHHAGGSHAGSGFECRIDRLLELRRVDFRGQRLIG
jgi:hypothetical protein